MVLEHGADGVKMNLKIKFGNHKLPDNIGVINMGPASDCPSRKRNLCGVTLDGIKCYALKAEVMYPDVTPYREAQKRYWIETSAYDIGQDIIQKIKRRRNPTDYLRFNESGDFFSQDDVDKLSTVAKSLKPLLTTYGYTARSDLDFSNVDFLVKGSNHNNGNNGKTIVISKDTKVPEGFLLCIGSCKKCNLCMINVRHNIAFRIH